MPYGVRKVGKRRWAIVNKRTGKRAGTSTSKRKAAISASFRNRAHKRRR
jgi:hypothetical protein